jgi:GPI mannosyltransferase 2
LGFGDCESLESLVGIGLSHATHGLSVLALYFLGRLIFTSPSGHILSFIAACLHVLSPAGLFLSAPYGESTFALLAFLGYLLFAQSFFVTGESAVLQDVLIVASGIVLGFATTIRSNGLLNGILFLEEFVRVIVSMRGSLRLASIRRLAATGVGGLCTAIGFLLPQYIAYQQYCNHYSDPDDRVQRVWCRRSLPSVYTFVQDHYW